MYGQELQELQPATGPVGGGAGQTVMLHAEHLVSVGGQEADRESVMLVERTSHALYGYPAVVLQDVHEEASGREALPEFVQGASAEFAVPRSVELFWEVCIGDCCSFRGVLRRWVRYGVFEESPQLHHCPRCHVAVLAGGVVGWGLATG